VLRLPDGYLCYDAPADAPPPGPPPALQRGYVTFGSFNKPEKIGAAEAALWSAVLRQTPGSRLLLKHRSYSDPFSCRRYQELFARHGVDPQRLHFREYTPQADVLREYLNVDIALDPLTYSGCVTTCEALWMGVPVISRPGKTFAGRHSYSHLNSAGLTELVAGDEDDYLERTLALAHDLPRLAKLRAELRARVANSALCDGPRFGRQLMQALRSIWRQWCARPLT
jgi:protein O-GlcNAc transferase